jgi:hypothetical protein
MAQKVARIVIAVFVYEYTRMHYQTGILALRTAVLFAYAVRLDFIWVSVWHTRSSARDDWRSAP